MSLLSNINLETNFEEVHAIPKVIHFEVDAHDLDRASKLYNEDFGWSTQIPDGMDYLMIHTGGDEHPATGGGFIQAEEGTPARTINDLDVPNFDEYMIEAADHGWKVLSDKTFIPGVGYFAYVEDTEDNKLSLMQFAQA